jgi:hypothetical protein
MWVFETLGIPVNAADGTVALPLWVAGILVALLIVLFVLSLVRTGMAGTLVFLAVLGFGGWAAWSWTAHERTLERRTLEARLAGLDAQALVPGSPLACLSPQARTLEAACEGLVFASGESTAGAVLYTAARLDLLDEAVTFARAHDPAFETKLEPLRRGLEQDRFGIVAHVLASRPNCTPDRCEALRRFQDDTRLRANLRDDVFEAHVARAAPKWRGEPSVRTSEQPAETPPPQTSGMGAPLPPGYNLPSASSIPPVSIMTAEPSGPEAPAAGGTPTPPPRPAQQRPAQQRAQQPQRPAQARPAPQRNAPATAEQPAGGGLPPPPRIQ